MEKSGLPVFTDIRSAIKSLDRFVAYHLGKYPYLRIERTLQEVRFAIIS